VSKIIGNISQDSSTTTLHCVDNKKILNPD
jgi:hypothetical protein